jgi:hypothetical protein
MAYTTVNKSSSFMNPKLYTSTGNDNLAITGVGFEADLTWIKKAAVVSGANTNEAHMWSDQVRGSGYYVSSSSTSGQTSSTNDLKSWQSDGFTLGTNNRVNQGSTPHTYAAWNWKANGSGSANTDGNGITSTVSANTTSGFSIVKYTGTGSASDTIGHGLGVKPAMVIMRPLGYSGAWWIVHKNLSTDNVLEFNTNAQANISTFGGGGLKYSTFTTSVIGGGNGSSNSDLWNTSGEDYIAYCFAEVQGYSRIGSFTVNGNSTNMIYTGFRPSFLLMKQYSSTSGNAQWGVFDNTRSGYNGKNDFLYANTEASEDSSNAQTLDFLSNGFKLRGEYVSAQPGQSNIYMAFGQTLVGTNGITNNAR